MSTTMKTTRTRRRQDGVSMKEGKNMETNKKFKEITLSEILEDFEEVVVSVRVTKIPIPFQILHLSRFQN